MEGCVPSNVVISTAKHPGFLAAHPEIATIISAEERHLLVTIDDNISKTLGALTTEEIEWWLQNGQKIAEVF